METAIAKVAIALMGSAVQMVWQAAEQAIAASQLRAVTLKLGLALRALVAPQPVLASRLIKSQRDPSTNVLCCARSRCSLRRS